LIQTVLSLAVGIVDEIILYEKKIPTIMSACRRKDIKKEFVCLILSSYKRRYLLSKQINIL
jgi:alanine racemase